MILIDNKGITDPHINLALEEYALRNFGQEDDYLLFYINEPSIIIGRNQNTLEEINDEYVKRKGIHVVRRMSGGGAVYHDLGNLNFSFITEHKKENLNNFLKFNEPVIEILREMGVPAEMSGRNDILANGRKISGNAQFSTGKRMFSHGTLLYCSDLDEVVKALNVKMSKIQSKGHKSVRSRVANIIEFIKNKTMSVSEFRQRILDGLYKQKDSFDIYVLSEKEWNEVYKLKEEKYGTWDWNFGNSPKFNIQRVKRFPAGEIDLRLDVHNGYIENLTIYGDFFGQQPVSELNEILTGVRYDPVEIANSLETVDTKKYFGDIEKENILNLFYGEDE
ncbi:MAG TPA: lipoate--protein ligase [Gracilimonas sp.]|uniref:lipoate--protein ligase n=1 Tax=Gracilimonas sp. TaxID=1974203 RepID=UPI002DB48685|nr:lipoate--protein ligase [Gracilimonas sp.]